ncbi:MAG: hypothetical protein ACRDIY_08960 [Chloroflexota bacterium]
MIHAMFNVCMDVTDMPLALITTGILVVAALAVTLNRGAIRAPARRSTRAPILN